MDYDIAKRFRAEFDGRVEEVYVNGRRVGMVCRDSKPPAEMAELWIAYTQSEHGANSCDEALGCCGTPRSAPTTSCGRPPAPAPVE